MRLAKLDEVLKNKILATSIKSRDGKKLLNEGTVLSDRIIDILKNSGLNAVYIEDDNHDIELHETLDDKKKAAITSKLNEIFMGIERNDFNSIELLRFIRTEIIPEIKNEPVSIPAYQVMTRDDYLAHSLNVAMFSIKTAINFGMNMNKVEQMAFIALVHDIGKILKARDKKLKDIPHYEIAYEFLKNKNCTVLSYMAVRFQEEYYNGSGAYKVPKEKQIDFARILSVCDFYENLLRTTSLLPNECFEKTQSLVNTRFDPEVFKAFRDAIYIYPIGLPVLLNNNAEGIIIRQNESYPLRPVVRTADKLYNLMDNLSIFIEKIAI